MEGCVGRLGSGGKAVPVIRREERRDEGRREGGHSNAHIVHVVVAAACGAVVLQACDGGVGLLTWASASLRCELHYPPLNAHRQDE